MPCVPRSQPDPMFNNEYATLECCTKLKKKKEGSSRCGVGWRVLGLLQAIPSTDSR